MTVMTDFESWQTNPMRPDPGRASPLLEELREYVIQRWGGADLGIYARRSIVGGTSLSSHGSGSAWDWRYQDPGVGRTMMLREVMPFLIGHSAELGIQAVHDYVGCSIWRANRANDDNGGWKTQVPGSQMGQSWALWLHLEVHPERWADERSAEQMLGLTGTTCGDSPPFTDLRSGVFGLWPMNMRLPTLRHGSKGDAVLFLQAVIYFRAGGAIIRDGDFGPQTERRVRDLQRVHGLVVDGIVGPKTWAVVRRLAR